MNGKALNLKGKNAEEFVYTLAKKTFFEDWCFPNPIIKEIKGDKEICDLLIVFDDLAIIWQVKDLKLDENGNYNKREVEKNLKQLSGARRFLFDLKKPIELENSRRKKEIFDPTKIKEIYLISALLGEGELISSFAKIYNNQHIHVFNRQFVEDVLTELDTIVDFVNYLKEKEVIFNKDLNITLMGGEHELLAYYLMNERTFSNLFEYDSVIITDDWWEELHTKPEYLAKKNEDKISYGWNGIIEDCHNNITEDNYEIIAKELAKTSRFERRCLGKAYYGACVFANNSKDSNFFMRNYSIPKYNILYTFVFSDMSNRKDLLLNVCITAKYSLKEYFSKSFKVIGIATQMKLSPIGVRELCYLDSEFSFNDDLVKRIEQYKKDLNIFQNQKSEPFHEDEYPK